MQLEPSFRMSAAGLASRSILTETVQMGNATDNQARTTPNPVLIMTVCGFKCYIGYMYQCIHLLKHFFIQFISK